MSESVNQTPLALALALALVLALVPFPDLDLAPLLAAAIPSKAVSILNIGCGNSALSADMYDAGFKAITNVDFSPVVIQEMKKKNELQRPEMKWQLMDMLRMTAVESASFDIVLDKGALDALFSEDTESRTADVSLMFTEIVRVLRASGSYVCVTLAQRHIATLLLSHFAPLCDIRISSVKLSDSSSELQPFVISLTKSFTPQIKVVLGSELRSAASVTEALAFISHSQTQNSMQSALRSTSAQLRLELGGAGSSLPRYIVHVVNLPKKKTAFALACACFIVPRGREHEWLFASEEGRKALADQVDSARLVIAALGRGHEFKDMEQVKSELSPQMAQLAPANVAVASIPFLTAEEGLGAREVIAQRKSDLSGEIVVEKVMDNGALLRRLAFLNAPHLVQAECRMLEGDQVDLSHLVERAQVILASLLFAFPKFLAPSDNAAALKALPPFKLLSVGLGSGVLEALLVATFPQVSVDVVELDPLLVDICKEYFALKNRKDDPRLSVHVADGLDYIAQLASKGGVENRRDAIVIDVDAKDLTTGLSAPPKAFTTPDFLGRAKAVLSEDGMLIVDVVCRAQQVYADLIATFKQNFASVIEMPVSEDSLNKIVLCFKAQPKQLNKAQAKLAAERFAKCYAFPKGLNFAQLVEELEYDWGQSAAAANDSKAGGKGRGNKGKRGKGRK